MFSALRNYNYKLFYYGQIVSLSGTWMQTIGLSWLVLQLTNSSVQLGLVTMLQFLPILLFTLIGGVVADRVKKRRFLQCTQTIALVQAAALGVLVATHTIQLWEVYVLAFVQGLNAAFDNPTRQAFVMEMVGREDLPNAVALNSGLFNAARIVGPGLGGLVIESRLGISGCFFLNAASFLAAIVALALMKPELFRAIPAGKKGKVLEQVKEGWRYCFSRSQLILITVLMAVVGTFGYNFTVTLPLLAKYGLNQGASALGALTSAMGIGSLIGAMYMARQSSYSSRVLLIGAGAFTLFLGLISLPLNFYITCGLLTCVGFSSILFNASGNTLMQMGTPDELRGRVMSIFFLLLAGSTPIGGYLTGVLTKYWGIRTTMGIEAAIAGAGVLWGIFYYLRTKAPIVDSPAVQVATGGYPTVVGRPGAEKPVS